MLLQLRDELRGRSGGEFSLDWAATYEDALAAMKRGEHDAYLIGYRLGERTGLDLRLTPSTNADAA